MILLARNARRFFASESGLAAVEYTAALFFIVALILGTMSGLGMALGTAVLASGVGL